MAIDTAHTPREPEDQIHFQARILTSIKAAIIATRPDGRIVYWNRFAEELYGWRAEEVIGRNILDITFRWITCSLPPTLWLLSMQGKVGRESSR